MKLRIFRCDNCKKETIPIEEKNTKGEVYPYSLGWVYIYEMEFKINEKSFNLRDKHFCSMFCMTNHIGELRWI